jgi:hypothetical protein
VSRETVPPKSATVHDVARIVQDLCIEIGSSFGVDCSSSRQQRNYGTNSLTETFLALKPTLSPATASSRASWCISKDFSGQGARGESENDARLDDDGINSTNGHSTDATDLEHLLQRKTKRLLGRAGTRQDGI